MTVAELVSELQKLDGSLEVETYQAYSISTEVVQRVQVEDGVVVLY